MASVDPIPPFPRDIDRDAFGHWLSGFVDGEGCFSLGVYGRKDGRIRMVVGFQLCLRADDHQCLELAQSFWQCGLIFHDPRKGQEPTNPQTRFQVNRAADLHAVVAAHFDRYPLRAKKANDFAIWRQGVELYHSVAQRPRGNGTQSRWRPEELEKFARLTEWLRSGRAYRPA